MAPSSRAFERTPSGHLKCWEPKCTRVATERELWSEKRVRGRWVREWSYYCAGHVVPRERKASGFR